MRRKHGEGGDLGYASDASLGVPVQCAVSVACDIAHEGMVVGNPTLSHYVWRSLGDGVWDAVVGVIVDVDNRDGCFLMVFDVS